MDALPIADVDDLVRLSLYDRPIRQLDLGGGVGSPHHEAAVHLSPASVTVLVPLKVRRIVLGDATHQIRVAPAAAHPLM